MPSVHRVTPVCIRTCAQKHDQAHWMLKHLGRLLWRVTFLAFMQFGRPVLFLILFCPFDGWIHAVLIIADSYPEVAVSNPVRLLTTIWGNSYFHTQIVVDQLHIFSQVWGSKRPHSKWDVGPIQVAYHCITISCAPASSDLTCFFKRQVHSCCYEPYPHTSPRQLHWPLPVLAPGCLPSHSLLDHVNQIQYTVAPSVPGVCVFDMPGPESFVHSFMYSFNHQAFMY